MVEVKLKFNEKAEGIFVLEDNGQLLAKLIVNVINNELIVQGMTASGRHKSFLYSKLFNVIISYAREHYLKIVAHNRFVHNRLKEHPNRYADVWDESNI
jgi:uncharacterized protein